MRPLIRRIFSKSNRTEAFPWVRSATTSHFTTALRMAVTCRPRLVHQGQNGRKAADDMESELIAIGLVLLVVAGVMLAAVGASPTPLDVHVATVHVESQLHVLASQLAERLPR